MDNMPNSSFPPTKLGPYVYQVIKKVEAATAQLSLISKQESIDIEQLVKLLSALPLEDNEGITYLEAAGQCILDTSNLVDSLFPHLNYSQRLAKKYRLMGKLLNIKADQIE